jgi:VanZ family protein
MTLQRRPAIVRFVFWAAIVFAFVMAVLPQPPRVPGVPSDKVQHIFAFLVLGALAFFAYPRTSPVFLAAALSLFGGLIELVQLIPALHRDGDPLDWIADTAAAIAVIVILTLLKPGPSKAV